MDQVRFSGTVSFADLPPHFGLIINLCFYEVEDPASPTPFGGDPPADAATDLHQVFERVDMEKEIHRREFERPFSLWHRPGHYFVEVRAILFRKESGKVFAQAEQFFFGARPVRIGADDQERITLPVSWPAIPLKDLPKYGTIRPTGEEA